jgi:flagellin
VAIRNANDAISLSQTAEGAIGKVGDMLQRMRELAVQSANATNGTEDRINLNEEFSQLQLEISRTVEKTKFNGKDILATSAGPLDFQVGANVGDTISLTTNNLTGTVAIGGDILNVGNSNTAITALDTALSAINTERATYGAIQNRFDAVIATLQVSTENESAARGRIMDADFATETANLSRSQILQQAGTAMVAQANQLPQMVLSLIR